MGGLSLISEEDSSKLMDSRVPADYTPQPRRSFHRNPPLTLKLKKSRRTFSIDDESIGFIDSIDPVDQQPPQPSRSFHRNPPPTSLIANSRKSVSNEGTDLVPYEKLGQVTVEDGEMEEMCDSRVSNHHRRSHRRLSISSALSYGSARSSFCYDKLLQLTVRLTIVKLDGSSFDTDVTEDATVADLKQEIQNVFSGLSIEEAEKISWEHVWGNFCLSFDGFKLLDDGENLREYGLNDGDKLHFIRNTSTQDHTKKQSRKRIDASKPHTIAEEEGQEVEYDIDSENMPLKHESRGNTSQRQSLLHRLFRGWFAYSQVSSGKCLTYQGTGTTRRSRGFVGLFKSTKD